MSRTTGCRGWTSPATNSINPVITSLSSYSSISGSTTVIAIIGSGFTIYSQVHFGLYTPDSWFINSGQINFYIPISASPGSYPIQVFNDPTKSSNIINYIVDNSIGFWNSTGNSISNSNTGGVNLTGSTTITGQTTIITSPSTTINGSLIVTGPGNITCTTLTQTSDYRIKDIIEPLNSSYTVDNLKPIKYLNKVNGKTEIGVIAHELQSDFPFLVTGEKDGEEFQTVNYLGLIGILIQEIQDLKAEIRQMNRI